MARPWVVVGCGGHGREVADVLKINGENILGFLDDNPDRIATTVGELPVLGDLNWLNQAPAPISIGLGIGGSRSRKQMVERICALPFDFDFDFPPIIHPSAILGSRVFIGEGTLIQAGCIMTCDIKVGRFVLLNIGVGLSHDVRIHDFASLAPKCQFTGATTSGALTEVGTGTLVIPQRVIGEGAITGAGAVIVRNIPDGVTAVGVPAIPRNQH